MKSRNLLLVLAAAAILAGQTADMGVTLERAIRKENVEGDLSGAIDLYKKVVAGAANRADVAKALLGLGECYEKQGSAEAQKAYERLVKEFGDQAEAARQAQVTGEARHIGRLVGGEPAAVVHGQDVGQGQRRVAAQWRTALGRELARRRLRGIGRLRRGERVVGDKRPRTGVGGHRLARRGRASPQADEKNPKPEIRMTNQFRNQNDRMGTVSDFVIRI